MGDLRFWVIGRRYLTTYFDAFAFSNYRKMKNVRNANKYIYKNVH